ncbi:Axin-1 [Manis javanica]|nr:Axin-1 [Manis javanica]
MLLQLAQWDPKLHLDDPERRAAIYDKYKEFVIPEAEAEWVGLTLDEAVEKQWLLEEKDPVPLSKVYVEELIEQLQQQRVGSVACGLAVPSLADPYLIPANQQWKPVLLPRAMLLPPSHTMAKSRDLPPRVAKGALTAGQAHHGRPRNGGARAGPRSQADEKLKKGGKCPSTMGAASPRCISSAKSHYSGLQRTGPEKAAVIKSWFIPDREGELPDGLGEGPKEPDTQGPCSGPRAWRHLQPQARRRMVPGEEGELVSTDPRPISHSFCSGKGAGIKGETSAATPRRSDLDLGGFRKMEPCDANEEKRLKLAKAIYQKYILDNNGIVSRQTKPATKSFIKDCIMKQLIDPAMFDQAQTEIQSTMEENIYPSFFKSDIYLEYTRTGSESPKLCSDQSSGSRTGKGIPGYLTTLNEDVEWKCDQDIDEDDGRDPDHPGRLMQKLLLDTAAPHASSSRWYSEGR